MNNSRFFKSPKEILPPSQFISIFDKNPILIEWDKVFELITQNEMVKSYTSIARDYLEKGDTSKYSKYKSKSGAITPASQCKGGHLTSCIQALTGIAMVDLDHLPNTDAVNTALELIKSDPHTFMAYITTSGVGIRIFAPYEASESEIVYLDAWRWVNQYYQMLTGYKFDEATKDAPRFSYLCHDPNCHYNPQAKKFYIDNSPHEIDTTTDTPQPDPIEKTEQILAKQGMHFVQGQRHHFLLNAAFLLNKMGVDRQEVISHYSAQHDDPQEVEKIINWAYDRATADHGTWKTNAPKAKTTKSKAQATAQEKETAEKKKSPSPQKRVRLEEIRQWLKANEALRYNELSGTLERYINPKWTPITDRTVNAIWEDINTSFDHYITISDFQNVINSDYIKSYNPIKEYIDHLPQWQPGDHDYLAELMSHVHTTTDDLFRIYFKKWFVATIASWLDPQVTNQTIFTLIGKQGIFKTTFMHTLLPPELTPYFLVKGNSAYLSKDDKIATGRYLIIDLEEIDALKPTELNAIKALVTTKTIDERAAYARNRERFYHLASFCATGNNTEFLTDQTGNRRWLVFQVVSIDDPNDYNLNYEGLYAQLFYLYRSGFRYWNTPKDDRILEEHLKQFCAPCPEEDLINQYYKVPDTGEPTKFLSATEIKIRCEAGTRLSLNLTTITQVLKKLNFELHKRRGKKGYLVHERDFNATNLEAYTLAQEILNEKESKEKSQKEKSQKEKEEKTQKETQEKAKQLELIESNPNLQKLNNILNPKE